MADIDWSHGTEGQRLQLADDGGDAHSLLELDNFGWLSYLFEIKIMDRKDI